MKKYFLISFFLVTASAVALYPVFILAASGIDINTASLQQLDEITGIGPQLAQRIVDTRPYSSVDDLLKVKGIGEKTLQKIKEQGIACVNCESAEVINNQIPITETESKEVQTSGDTISASQTVITYPAGIVFNEILPSPEGPDDQKEWIEIYNQNDFEVDLYNWQIKDNVGATKTYIFPIGSKISAHEYLVVRRPDTKITLNNDEDELNLLSPDKKVVSAVSYEKALKNQSYNNYSSGWFWNLTLTPGKENVAKTESKPKEIISLDNTSDNKLAGIRSPLTENNNEGASEASQEKKTASAVGIFQDSKLSVFLLALIIAVISGGMILYLKKILTRPF